MYMPSVEFERQVPLSITQFVGQYHHCSDSETGNFIIDTWYQFPIMSPYSPMLVNYAMLLEFLVKISWQDISLSDFPIFNV